MWANRGSVGVLCLFRKTTQFIILDDILRENGPQVSLRLDAGLELQGPFPKHFAFSPLPQFGQAAFLLSILVTMHILDS